MLVGSSVDKRAEGTVVSERTLVLFEVFGRVVHTRCGYHGLDVLAQTFGTTTEEVTSGQTMQAIAARPIRNEGSPKIH